MSWQPSPLSPLALSADPCATIVAAGFDTLIVCLHCYGELRSWRPETIEAFRQWHRDKCGLSTNPQVNGVQWGSEGGPGDVVSAPGPWPETYEGGRA